MIVIKSITKNIEWAYERREEVDIGTQKSGQDWSKPSFVVPSSPDERRAGGMEYEPGSEWKNVRLY
jgi:hypothetical protein